MIDISVFLEYLRSQKTYQDQIIHVENIPPKEAEYGGLDLPLNEILMEWLINKKYKLWVHQADAINHVLKGNNVIIATSTSSGKSMCYNLPVLNSILNHFQSKALYIYPRKALTQDQLIELQKIIKELNVDDINVGVYDGDTPSEMKRQIRANADIIMTNPYALHRYLPYFKNLWTNFCRNLKYVILDEVHMYKGVFGTNVAFLIRRLKRILASWGVNPQWILSSATINDPVGFGEKLVGEKFSLVDNDGSPSGAKSVILWDLPYDDLENKYRSGNSESKELFKYHLEHNIQTLLFTKSRKMAELQSVWAKSDLYPIRKKIESYRAGLSRKDRREIEQGLKAKQLLGICSTNALELGIDVGSLEATISSGFPGTISSFKQQIGRSGRGESHSISTLVPQANPLDFFYIHNPDILFGPVQEKLLINLGNGRILKNQLRCAASEKSLKLDEFALFGLKDEASFRECLESLSKKQDGQETPYLKRVGKKYTSNEKHPSTKVNIDNLSDERYTIHLSSEDDKKVYLTTDDEEHVYRDIHPGAIFYYRSRQFLVEDVDFNTRTVLVSRTRTNYFTVSLYDTIVRRLETLAHKELKSQKDVEVFQGKVNIRQCFHSYVKINNKSQETIETEDLDIPDLEFNTEAIWLVIPNPIKKLMREKNYDFSGCLHGVLHALIHMVPIQAQIDKNDIGGTCIEHDEEHDRPMIYIYEQFREGIGITERIYEKITIILQMARDLIKRCPCTSKKGCPGCIMASNCVKLNEELNKKGALLLLNMMISGISQFNHAPSYKDEEKEEIEPSKKDLGTNSTCPPERCPACGKKLALWKGKHGYFFGCRGYPSCDYSLSIADLDDVLCPKCESLMKIRSGPHGRFLGCLSFPQCNFTYTIFEKK